MVLYILHDDDMTSSFNFTHIALIPKICNPLVISDFQPISLCNAIYKLVSKSDYLQIEATR